ncbi:MAG: hypothetical protein Q6373_003665 [Candidatus Sigynarchaeota archaeon]
MQSKVIFRELIFPVAMMAGFGTFFWGIRGTGGYGGSMGGLFAGTGWAVLWYFLSNNDGKAGRSSFARPIASRWAFLALAAGIMVGGFHGYGQFISWIKGSWMIQSGTPVDVDPAWGFLGLLQCGLSWGGTAGAVLGWAIPGTGDSRAAKLAWMRRAILGSIGAGIGLITFLAFPGLLLPLYGSVYYANLATCAQCARAVETAASSAIQFGMFGGFFAAEIVNKNWRGLATSIIMAAGFGTGFVISSGWFFMSLPSSWKAWEMSIGAIGGASIGVAHFATNRPVSKQEQGLAPGVFAVTERMFQPPTERSIVFGHNLPLVLGVSLALYNGMKPEDGFAGNFFAGDVGATTMVMGITYAMVTAMWGFFILSVIFLYKAEYRGKRWFGQPLVQAIVIQGILVAIGFMTTIVPDVPLPESVVFVAGTYVVGLVIGGSALAGVAIIDGPVKTTAC